jgi:hypothetical protein
VDGSDANTANGIYAIGAEVLLNNVKIDGCKVGLRVADDDGEEARDSKVRLVGCNLTAKDYAIVVKGNGSESEQRTQLIVEDCTIVSDSVGISGNGTKSKNGTDIQVIHSTITCTDGITTGIFHPQADSKLTIYNSIITAYTGLAIKGGDVSVVESNIMGTGAAQEPAFRGSGCSDTGDAIYIETNYEGDILLEISGNKIESIHGKSLQIYKPDAPNVTVRIYSGEFKEEQPDAFIAEGSEKNGDGNIVTVKKT